jgi:hypothetical protein
VVVERRDGRCDCVQEYQTTRGTMNKAKTIIVKDEDDDKADGNVPLL